MTFNEGMQIDTSTTSTSGGGRRGPGRGMAIGGGLGGLLIVVLALFLGVDPGQVLPQQQQMDSEGAEAGGFDLSQCRTGADANEIVQCRVVATGNSVDGVWQQLLQGYQRPQVRLFTGQVNTGCGTATSDVGPFYCPVDKTAYFDTDFFDVLKTQFGSSGGPLAQEYVVAHEFGHHVQNLLGVLGRAQRDPEGATGAGVRTELQADCYAGVWAHYASITRQESTGVPFLEPLSDKDIADALSAAASVGDDRIQQSATGRVNPEAWTHGSSAQRQKWFTEGYRTGDPNKCDTFATNDLG
ncbi:KPN_02809 family neutral zinc metallopeptidase [Mycolicibacterium smegmatis]|uniref:Metallopeptidase, zinc binding n=2 Tax=Mycolicibacterium smegmatis (strain ATCC 700084 / mc(2)155) TaxID=246196 RepID=A0QWN0_MYCS2|nr:neutral zinc metallopeptidase [Mycolicibacterium smegmatis]ABK73060.1 metallopeptidase, zinc binding [Mycolicibacterium smegmatis MC2 155]AFP39389.1 Conserved membrane glycine rich protein [Mycolicibacterium smegmatis MC2 155]AIU08157.1 membrane protein [Mycolicibacterium smegmatis MC2 155]AIU14782.1 membrane protein [Mycolicibacterium smegmatis]AIU21405.1 membrane protein [Mycolicibacterium smegmatis]